MLTNEEHNFRRRLQGVREVVDAWEKMKFNVIKYIKGNQDRGYVLGACDEVLQTLDDHTMALQSMAGSRFIGPFLVTVQQWEKSLSLIAEVRSLSFAFTHMPLLSLSR